MMEDDYVIDLTVDSTDEDSSEEEYNEKNNNIGKSSTLLLFYKATVTVQYHLVGHHNRHANAGFVCHGQTVSTKEDPLEDGDGLPSISVLNINSERVGHLKQEHK